MRITNKVMQNNALTNINRNKELQDSLNTQLSTGKKVFRPSDDPVTAIRALRLRSDVSQVSQFYSKNVPDANSWLELTESSIKTIVSVVTDMVVQCEKGSNDTLTTSDRQTIINSLKQLRDEVYSTGNADYAGRYIFTGYRTDTPLTFTENVKERYLISQGFEADEAEEMTYVPTKTADGRDLLDISETSFDGTSQMVEQDIDEVTFYRYRLAYDNLNGGAYSFGFLAAKPDENGKFDVLRENGVQISVNTDTIDNKDEAYRAASEATGYATIFVPSTGELLMSKDLYNLVKEKNGYFNMSYNKSSWNKGDLVPQHYFPTVKYDDKNQIEAKYNYDDGPINGYLKYLNQGIVDQPIEYQVGFNQNIRVNTSADEVFKHGIRRDVDELIEIANQLEKVEETKSKLTEMSKNTTLYSAEEITNIKKDLDAANKAYDLIKDQLQNRFSKAITDMQSYLDNTNEALSLVGNRSARLELIENRLSNQNTTFKTLQSENEDADATEVAVQLSSAKISYQAALMATSDMIQETLLNYL